MFDSNSGLGEPKLMALVEVMVLAANADGDFGEDEHKKVHASVTNLTSDRFEAPAIDDLIRNIVARAKESPRPERLRAVRDALGDAASNRVALELAIGVMLADGVVRTSERELILEMAECMGIPGEDAADLLRSLSK